MQFTLKYSRAWGLLVVGPMAAMAKKRFCEQALDEADRQYRLWYSADGWPGATRPDYVERSDDTVTWRPVPLYVQPEYVLTVDGASASVVAEDGCGELCDPYRAPFCRLRTRQDVDSHSTECAYTMHDGRLWSDGVLVSTPWTLERVQEVA